MSIGVGRAGWRSKRNFQPFVGMRKSPLLAKPARSGAPNSEASGFLLPDCPGQAVGFYAYVDFSCHFQFLQINH